MCWPVNEQGRCCFGCGRPRSVHLGMKIFAEICIAFSVSGSFILKRPEKIHPEGDAFFVISLVLFIILGILTSCLMLYGYSKQRPSYYFPFFILMAINLMLSFMLFAYGFLYIKPGLESEGVDTFNRLLIPLFGLWIIGICFGLFVSYQSYEYLEIELRQARSFAISPQVPVYPVGAHPTTPYPSASYSSTSYPAMSHQNLGYRSSPYSNPVCTMVPASAMNYPSSTYIGHPSHSSFAPSAPPPNERVLAHRRSKESIWDDYAQSRSLR